MKVKGQVYTKEVFSEDVLKSLNEKNVMSGELSHPGKEVVPISAHVVDSNLYLDGHLVATGVSIVKGGLDFGCGVSSRGYGEYEVVIKNRFLRKLFGYWLPRKLLWFVYHRVARIRVITKYDLNSVNIVI